MAYPDLSEISLYITKSSMADGEMRWSAVNSDTDWDLYNERMSIELFKSMIGKINRNEPPPTMFADFITSDYWKGGMPYLSIAHYSDGNGRAVPGKVQKLYIDGTQLKAKGILYNTPLGEAVWKSLKEDELQYKNDVNADRIRISIAFVDLAHQHGDGKLFVRKSLDDRCDECKKGIGNKTYVDGYLVHLAMTRVPVNRRTIMEAEDGMTKKSKPVTRKEDAISVLGGNEDLAELVAEEAMESKSEAIVEMSDTQEDTPEVPVSEPPVHPEVVEAKSMDSEENAWKPFGGATSMKEAKKYTEAQQESWRVSDLYYTFTDVARNIMESEGIDDKASELASLVDEFKKMLVAKSLYEELSQIQEGQLEEVYMTTKKSELEGLITSIVAKSVKEAKNGTNEKMDEEEDAPKKKSDTVSIPVQKSALELSVDNLYNTINGAIAKSVSSDAKLQEIQPALEALGTEILNVVKSSTNEPAPVQPDSSTAILEEIRNLSLAVQSISTEVATMKAQSQSQVQPQSPRVPVPRSVIVKSDTPNAPEVKPGSVKDVIRRSVGL